VYARDGGKEAGSTAHAWKFDTPMTANPILRLRAQFYRSAYFPVMFLLLIAEFYFIPEDKWQNNLFRVGLLLPFLLVFPWQNFKPRLYQSSILQVTGLLIFCLLLSLAWSPATDPEMIQKTLYHGLYVTGFVLIGTDILLRNPAYADRFFYWLGWLIILTGVLSIWRFYQEHGFPMDRLKAIGQLQHSGFAAMSYGFIGLYHFMATPRSMHTSAWQRWLPGILAAGMGLTVLLLAQSRGGLLALLLVLLLGALLSRQKRFMISLLLVVLSLLVMTFLWSEQLLSVVTRGGWDSYRLEIWGPAIDLILQAPILGHGILGDYTFDISPGEPQHHAHNILLSTLLYGGMLSGSMLLLLIGLTVRQGWQCWIAEHDIKPLLLTVFGLTYMMTDGYRLVSNPFPNWVYFWLPVIWAISRELCNKAQIAFGSDP
jgi:O-antigen ligase